MNLGDRVFHPQFGEGEVEIDRGDTLLVRFGTDYKSVALASIVVRRTAAQRLDEGIFDPLPQVLLKAQALAIRSLHAEWGLFSPSRIQLLPHQLWVCQQVCARWPTRYLVADDVGLGKTVEAGMILSALYSRGLIRRLLILCPASLVAQWQQRMLDMFDIRLVSYNAAADTARGANFWKINDHVVASLHTLRTDSGGRHRRMEEAEPFDMVLVDEAHHLNATEEAGATLGLRLLRNLEEAGRIRSLVLFTGTPHRGKDFGFLSLLSLLDPQFDPKRPMTEMLPGLRHVMIRNNKASVTDLQGQPIFHSHRVHPQEFHYSPAEEQFYDMLTRFITDGRAYSRTLSRTQGEAVKLVLIALQKLASSSVAAIRRAIERRLQRVVNRQETLSQLERQLEEADEDQVADLDVAIAGLQLETALTEHEEPALRELLAAAQMITTETKIESILDLIEHKIPGRSVLFFTEYKATQSLLMRRLRERFDSNSVSFINGDGFADEVEPGRRITESRASAAERFNRGAVRFLVSTEAAGEGIDLQESCHTLVHVDLPWNPMRLHQRVGRLNRYGQKEVVEVYLYRNPETVEARIWELLNAKIERINQALGAAMDEPEDMLELVLGMTSTDIFQNIFAGALENASGARLDQWFDRASASFGGEDVLDAVRRIIGSASRFDLQKVSHRLPRLDLPDLIPFFESAIQEGGRRIQRMDGQLGFRTPEAWRKSSPAIRPEYQGLVLDRSLRGEGVQLIGVGSPIFDAALDSATEEEATVAVIPAALLPAPLVVFRLFSRESLDVGNDLPRSAGILLTDPVQALRDDALLTFLNDLARRRPALVTETSTRYARELIDRATTALEASIGDTIPIPFDLPGWEPMALIVPDIPTTNDG
jgi:ERCC4-related helicase